MRWARWTGVPESSARRHSFYPGAEIPALQLSLLKGLDPAQHLKLGQAMRELLGENMLVIGSGFSFHNMGGFVWDGSTPADSRNDEFQGWLIETCTGDISQAEREQRLREWQQAPGARYCHPWEEHLMPLHVYQGMAGRPASVIFDDYILGKRGIALKW